MSGDGPEVGARVPARPRTASGDRGAQDGTNEGYLGAHLEEALAEDGRVAEPGLHVQVAGNRVVVSGTVSDPERKRSVSEVLEDLVGGRELVDLTDVAGAGPPPEEHV
jgi:osmotically-inducible protein OsmY